MRRLLRCVSILIGIAAFAAPASASVGHISYMGDSASWADKYLQPNCPQAAWFESHWTYARAYPPSDNIYPTCMPTLPWVAYHDWYLEGSQIWEAGPREAYAAKVTTDLSHGFVGVWADDTNFSSGYNKVGSSQELYNRGEAETLELIRAQHPSAHIEINPQYHDLWPRIKEGEPLALRAVATANSIFKEFGWGPTAGINSATDYRESLEYADWIHAHGKSLTSGWDYNQATIPTEEYDLATMLLVSNGTDHIDFDHQHPAQGTEAEVWWIGFGTDLGEALGSRERSSSGLWTRHFVGGEAFVVEPGGTTQTVSLGGQSRTLSAGQGVTLQGEAPPDEEQAADTRYEALSKEATEAAERAKTSMEAARTAISGS